MYQHVSSNILVPIFQVQLHSAREALAEAAVGKNLFGPGKSWYLMVTSNYVSTGLYRLHFDSTC